jgi:UDP-N-acetylmuramate dehydrogenase
MEVFWDIPSSIGGAVAMNAGASGEEIKDVLIKVQYLDLIDLKVKEMLNQDIGFVYRNSFFQQNSSKIVIEAEFKLNKGDKVEIENKMNEIRQKRWEKQPREYPNCGSVFKRPEGRFVGPMLDELNLKGFSVGGAQISEKHSGFIVNKGDATGSDILNLIKEVQKRVKAKFGVDLEVEQRII